MSTFGLDLAKGIASGLAASDSGSDRVIGSAMAGGLGNRQADADADRDLRVRDAARRQDFDADVREFPQRLEMDMAARRAASIVKFEEDASWADWENARNIDRLKTFRTGFPGEAGERDPVADGVDTAMQALKPSAHLGPTGMTKALASLENGDPQGLEGLEFGVLEDGQPAVRYGAVVVPVTPSVWLGALQHRTIQRERLRDYAEQLQLAQEITRHAGAAGAAMQNVPGAKEAYDAIGSLAQIDPRRAAVELAALPGRLARREGQQAAADVWSIQQETKQEELKRLHFGNRDRPGQVASLRDRTASKVRGGKGNPDDQTLFLALNAAEGLIVNPDVVKRLGPVPPEGRLPGLFDFRHDRTTGEHVVALSQRPEFMAPIVTRPQKIEDAQQLSDYAQRLDAWVQTALGWPPSDPATVLAALPESITAGFLGEMGDAGGEGGAPGQPGGEKPKPKQQDQQGSAKPQVQRLPGIEKALGIPSIGGGTR